MSSMPNVKVGMPRLAVTGIIAEIKKSVFRIYSDTLFSVFRALRLLQYGVPAVGVRLVAELYRPQLII